MTDNYKALYQPWKEQAFWSDPEVRHMTNMGRWAYRTLLQSAFICETRPYLPDNDNKLWVLADCESLAQWLELAPEIRKMFRTGMDDGPPVLFHQQVVDDWDRLREVRDAKSKGGKKAQSGMKTVSPSESTQARVLQDSSKTLGEVSKEVSKKEREEGVLQDSSKTLETEPNVDEVVTEEDVIIEKALADRALVYFPGAPCDKLAAKDRADLRALAREVGIDAMVARFNSWAVAAVQGGGRVDRPLAAFVRRMRGIPDGDPIAKTPLSVTDPRTLLETLTRIGVISGGDCVIGGRNAEKVSAALSTYGQGVVVEAFRDYWAGYDGKPGWSEVDFAGKVVVLCELVLGQRKRRVETDKQLADAKVDLERQGQETTARLAEDDVVEEPL